MTEWIKVRVATDEQARWKKGAADRGMKMSDLIRAGVELILDGSVPSAPLIPAPIAAAVIEQGGTADALRRVQRARTARLARERAAKTTGPSEPARASVVEKRPPPGARFCPDHPSLIVHSDQKTCRFLRCGNRIP